MRWLGVPARLPELFDLLQQSCEIAKFLSVVDVHSFRIEVHSIVSYFSHALD